jgi:hypothetical protein
MSVDTEDRNKVADAIERYLAREIDNFELDDILFTAEDRAAFEVACEVWFCYDDIRRHKNEGRHKILPPGETRLRRWVSLLRSDQPWPRDEPDSRDRWYSGRRWRGIMAPIGCVFALLMLPIFLFEAVVLGRPRPRSAKNEYWPFESSEDWKRFASSPVESADSDGRCPHEC